MPKTYPASEALRPNCHVCQQLRRAVEGRVAYFISRCLTSEKKLWAADITNTVCHEHDCADCASLGES